MTKWVMAVGYVTDETPCVFIYRWSVRSLAIPEPLKSHTLEGELEQFGLVMFPVLDLKAHWICACMEVGAEPLSVDVQALFVKVKHCCLFSAIFLNLYWKLYRFIFTV